jgi:hypothetical protein
LELQESEANKTDMPLMADFVNSASVYAEDNTGQLPPPQMPVFKNPRMAIQANTVLRDARAKNVAFRAQAKRLDDAIEAGAVDFGPQGMVIDETKLQAHQQLRRSQDLSRTPMDIENTEAFIAANPNISESDISMLRGRARTRGGVGVERANVTVEDLKNIGLVTTPQEEQEAKAQAVQNKLSPSSKTSDSIAAADQAAQQMRSAFKRIKEFNEKYNSQANSNDAFKEFVGPIDNPVLSAEARFAGVTDLDKKEALSIIQQMQQVILDYRNAKFGATLTEGEKAAMEEVVGTPRRNDFLVLTESFADNLERGLKTTLGRFKYAPNLIEYYKSYTPERFQKTQGVEGSQAPALPSGWKFTP